jgi:GNAT superfamily N-acetyltransferase
MEFKSELMGKYRGLFHDNKFRSIEPKYYEWKIYQNPFLQGKICLEKRDHKAVSSVTITPKKINLLGEVSLAAEIGDVITLPPYRRQGISTKLCRQCIEYALSKGINIIYGTPNQLSLRLLGKLGFMKCDYIAFTSMTKTLKPFLCLTSIIGKILLLKNIKHQLRQLRLFFKSQISLKNWIYKKDPSFKKENDYKITELKKIRDDIDGLWGSPRFSFFTIRDKAYLNWRYFLNPDHYHILAAKNNNDFLGYLVFKLDKEKEISTVCDFITLNDRIDVFYKLMREAEKMLKNMGVHLIQIMCLKKTPYYKALVNLGYNDILPKKPRPIIIYSQTKQGESILKNTSKWHFTLADSDNI